MSKSVLISIKPEWCEKIANGEKTIEVRKTKPNIETPFKCYIYCTKGGLLVVGKENAATCYCGNGKVIGEFICDEIYGLWAGYAGNLGDDCLTFDEREQYLDGKMGYGWHISGLKIYDEPKELSDFCKPCKHDCWQCEYYSYSCDPYEPSYCDWERYIESTDIIKRPPQSWCYVEEI